VVKPSQKSSGVQAARLESSARDASVRSRAARDRPAEDDTSIIAEVRAAGRLKREAFEREAHSTAGLIMARAALAH
jgi:hypothetical protein